MGDAFAYSQAKAIVMFAQGMPAYNTTTGKQTLYR
jgi:hypothetical protein